MSLKLIFAILVVAVSILNWLTCNVAVTKVSRLESQKAVLKINEQDSLIKLNKSIKELKKLNQSLKSDLNTSIIQKDALEKCIIKQKLNE